MSVLRAERRRSGTMPIRDVALFVKVVGRGDPLLLMHGGPSADHTSMLPFRRLADQFTLVFYDHRGNGRSTGAPSSMTWENLTADADALRQRLGFERWAMLGHSFGGHVARQHALELLAERGYSPEKVELVRRWFSGELAPREWWPIFLRISSAYSYDTSLWPILREVLSGGWRFKPRPEALIFCGR